MDSGADGATIRRPNERTPVSVSVNCRSALPGEPALRMTDATCRPGASTKPVMASSINRTSPGPGSGVHRGEGAIWPSGVESISTDIRSVPDTPSTMQ